MRLFLLALSVAWGSASAESVQVKYHGLVRLDAFACVEIKDTSDVSRVCYDAAERYMVIRLGATYYHYCSVDAATVEGLQTANSKRKFFEARIRGDGKDGPFDCRTHAIPRKYRL